MIRFAALALLAACYLCLCSCSDDQIARAQVFVDQTDVRLQAANHAVELAKAAVDQAHQLAEQFQSAGAKSAADQASAALEQVKQVRDIAATTNKAAHDALDGAKTAQAAGGSSVDVLLAAAKGAVPFALAAALAGLKWWQAFRANATTQAALGTVQTALSQTVVGLDAARGSMGEEAWKQHVAPHLAAEQDQASKQTVAQVQVQAA